MELDRDSFLAGYEVGKQLRLWRGGIDPGYLIIRGSSRFYLHFSFNRDNLRDQEFYPTSRLGVIIPKMSQQEWEKTVNGIEISVDRGKTWESIDVSLSYYSSKDEYGNEIFLRGSGITRLPAHIFAYIVDDNDQEKCIKIIGNIEYLLDYKTVLRGEHPQMEAWCFWGLFQYWGKGFSDPDTLDVSNLILGAEQLSPWCYCQMFYEADSLINSPKFHTKKLNEGCYEEMFAFCPQFDTASPALMIIEEEQEMPPDSFPQCYAGMFQFSGISVIPDIDFTIYKDYCCLDMFRNCQNIKNIPSGAISISGTSFNCCAEMFSDCHSLLDCSSINFMAEEMAESSCAWMFYRCRSLISIPEIFPAKTVLHGCYSNMFTGCSELKAKNLPLFPKFSEASNGGIDIMFDQTGTILINNPYSSYYQVENQGEEYWLGQEGSKRMQTWNFCTDLISVFRSYNASTGKIEYRESRVSNNPSSPYYDRNGITLYTGQKYYLYNDPDDE